MTLEEAESWLSGLINVERAPSFADARLSLAPIRSLLERLGNPEAGLPALHIAGSKGKGSTALIAEAVLRAAGVSTGTYTSPHLSRWTERFRVDGREVDGAALAAAVERLRPHVEALRAGPDAPSFFDATTAAAFLLFAEAEVEVAILEVGLGGRLDSTNACRPRVCAITHIELEHTERLGDTLAEIAAEKAGIVKPGVPVVTGALAAEAAEVVAARSRALGAPLARLGHEFRTELLDAAPLRSRLRFEEGGLRIESELGVAGAHQVANAGVALAAIRRFGGVDDRALAAAARSALPQVVLPGRVEVREGPPQLVIDGAHTAASARALALVLEALPRVPTHLVLSVSAGKDVDAICAAFAPLVARVSVTRAEPLRSLDPSELAECVRRAAPGIPVEVVEDAADAVRAACAAGEDIGRVVVTGSVYLAGIARDALGSGGASAP